LDIAPERDDSEAVPFYRRAFLWLKGRSIMMRIVLACRRPSGFALCADLPLSAALYPSGLDADAARSGLLRGYDRQWVSIDDISPVLVQSVMMSEDGQYCFHGGVDWGEMRMLVTDTLRRQVDARRQHDPDADGEEPVPVEQPLLRAQGDGAAAGGGGDFVWSKRRLMEIYLNIAEWGPGIYGIEAAARYHFKVPASKLSSRQAALLAVSLPNPIDRNAGKPGRGLRRLAAVIERRARSSGEYIRCIYD
jgi:monofunctional biosynthetic peptidoglycan transglycosylase